MKKDDGWENPLERERTLRFAANRVCLWYICGQPPCWRAKACRGDARACAGLIDAWFAAIDEDRRAHPDFATIESRIETPQELRAYRFWRRAKEAQG